MAEESTGDMQPSATIHSLPSEILGSIFLLIRVGPTHYCTLNTDDAPWTLTRVCKWWRIITLSQPMLWSTPVVSQPMYGNRHGPSQISALKLILHRSAPSPLKVTFFDYDFEEDVAEEMMHLLVGSSNRWNEVNLGLKFNRWRTLSRVHGNLPLLSRLEFRPYGAQPFESFGAFEDAPKLEHVQLGVDDIAPYPLPFSQLKTFTGPAPGAIEVLAQAHLLKELESEFNPYYPAKSENHPPIRHFALRRLKTSTLSSLHCLTTPSLKSLEVQWAAGVPVSNQHIVDFILRSQCSLTSLTVGYIDWGEHPAANVRALLSCVPELLYLGIFERDGAGSDFKVPWDEVLQSLIISDSTQGYAVQHLSNIFFLANKPVIDGTGSLLLAMMDSRQSHYRGPDRFSARLYGFDAVGGVVG